MFEILPIWKVDRILAHPSKLIFSGGKVSTSACHTSKAFEFFVRMAACPVIKRTTVSLGILQKQLEIKDNGPVSDSLLLLQTNCI